MDTQELNLQNQQQSQKLESLGKLASGIAHDFKNYLTGILSYSELIEMFKENPDKVSEFNKKLQGVVQNSNRVIDQLLVFSRNSIGKQDKLEINNLMEETIGFLKFTKAKNIKFEFQPSLEPLFINGEKALLQSCFINLGINSMDAMDHGGTIRIEVSRKILSRSISPYIHGESIASEYAEILFIDTGSGIPEEYLSQVFDPFFTTKEPGKGTGLGLSTVYGTILNHQGSIQVVSEVNDGTTFIIDLPLLTN